MFRGANAINIDSKGRLAIPTKYRQALVDDCDGQMICTIDTKQPCLLLYPLHEWEEVEVKLLKLSTMVEQENRLQRLLLGNAAEGEMDKNGRVNIPPHLRQYAALDKQIMLVGRLNRFEIWDTQTWQAQMSKDVEIERAQNFELTERLQDFSL